MHISTIAPSLALSHPFSFSITSQAFQDPSPSVWSIFIYLQYTTILQGFFFFFCMWVVYFVFFIFYFFWYFLVYMHLLSASPTKQVSNSRAETVCAFFIRLPGFKSCFFHVLSAWLWALVSSSTKKTIITAPTSWVCVKIKWILRRELGAE